MLHLLGEQTELYQTKALFWLVEMGDSYGSVLIGVTVHSPVVVLIGAWLVIYVESHGLSLITVNRKSVSSLALPISDKQN